MTPVKKTVSTRKPRKEWHLVCISRLGKVSMLRDMDLYTARETYKRLLPDTRPKKHVFSDCKKCRDRGWSTSWGRLYGPTDDWLEKVEIIGPAGQEMAPWCGVKPRVINHPCRCATLRSHQDYLGYDDDDDDEYEDEPAPAIRPARWNRRRTDFWNHPRLWDRVKDTHRQMCWETVR